MWRELGSRRIFRGGRGCHRCGATLGRGRDDRWVGMRVWGGEEWRGKRVDSRLDGGTKTIWRIFLSFGQVDESRMKRPTDRRGLTAISSANG
jgi:hypothetical protein